MGVPVPLELEPRDLRALLEAAAVVERAPDLLRETSDPAAYEKQTIQVKHVVGRDRNPGSWALAAIGYVRSTKPEITLWEAASRRRACESAPASVSGCRAGRPCTNV